MAAVLAVWRCVYELKALLLLRVRYVYVLVCWCSLENDQPGGSLA